MGPRQNLGPYPFSQRGSVDMVPPKKPPIDDDDEYDDDYRPPKRYTQREIASVVAQILIQKKAEEAANPTSEAKGDKNSFIYKAKDWLSIILTLVAWFASITYLAGSLGQRLSEVEIEVKTLKDTTMTKDLLDEKFNGVSIRLRSLEERQQDFAQQNRQKQ